MLTLLASEGGVVASHRTQRSVDDHYYGDRMGIAASRESERVAASLGASQQRLPGGRITAVTGVVGTRIIKGQGALWSIKARLLWFSDGALVFMFYGVKSRQDAGADQAM